MDVFSAAAAEAHRSLQEEKTTHLFLVQFIKGNTAVSFEVLLFFFLVPMSLFFFFFKLKLWTSFLRVLLSSKETCYCSSYHPHSSTTQSQSNNRPLLLHLLVLESVLAFVFDGRVRDKRLKAALCCHVCQCWQGSHLPPPRAIKHERKSCSVFSESSFFSHQVFRSDCYFTAGKGKMMTSASVFLDWIPSVQWL